MKNKRNFRRAATRVAVLAVMLSIILSVFLSGGAGSVAAAESVVRLFGGAIDTQRDSFFDDSLVYRLPAAVKEEDELSLIIEVQADSLLDGYEDDKSKMSVSEYALSEEAEEIRRAIAAEKAALLAALDETGIAYTVGADYETVLSGFELLVTARDFETVCTTFDGRANTYIGEVYEKAETELVENDVNVYDTGIFNSSEFGYDGTGIVVAVLDTGLDYNHTAFSTSNFTADRSRLGLTFDEVAALISDTTAAELRSGLTASDVYVSEKIPFGFDYADGDADVYPIASDHGTHVSGIIAGKDSTITGVAPNAQIVAMKTFSDIKSSAYATWILSALEDCVVLGVDVINMSLGTPCGFSRESDDEMMSGVYERIREQGISLVVAAANNYNSTFSSEKNGNLGLTSNPDSATVGSPSTYEGALSVASVSGVKTPYMLYNGKIVYFNESTNRIAKEKHFVEELLSDGRDGVEIEYVTIPGAGRSADYTGIDVTGKIVLVSRGSTTFEEKSNVAQNKGAAGIIIYNNVSGDIKMNVGDTTIPVCSISQDDGEMLAAAGTGKITVNRSQTSGPFMSDFSSWGPSPSLGIKPEITAHGGSIFSAVPGQSYDHISGTSMATPNISGVTALLRQYVKENFPAIASDSVKVTALVNQLMMSTADILYAKNGLPYSVRKQGAGLANLNDCAATTAYITTARADGTVMDKPKIELGDDPDRNGVYALTFTVNNFGASTLTYDVSTYVMTEGVSDTKTSHGETTVTEEAYILKDAEIAIASETSGAVSGTTLTVPAGQNVTVTVTVTLGIKDKQYLESSFKNGMYVEGFVVLDAKSGTEVDLSVPYLAFYGDWTVAPLLDLDYFETNKDELDDSIDPEDKTLPDAYATRPVGGIEGDYVNYLGSYYFMQDPADTKISADRKYIALTNQTSGVNSLRFIWVGLLRNAERVEVTITDDATGEIVYETTDKDIRKSYSDGNTIYPANVDVEFSAIDHALKNNTAYTVKMKAFLDYGDGGEANNLSNEFEFPLVTDFEAPAVTDCEFYTEYDNSAKEMRYYARISVYDNHYAMALQAGYVGMDTSETGYTLHSFEQYLTPIYSSFNSTSYVVYELTDHIDAIRKNANNRNTFTVACYDYALNDATYEIELPDDFLDLCFAEKELVLSPNEVYDLTPLVYPESEWSELLEFYCTVPASGEVARVVNNSLVAVAPGKAVVIARDPVSKKQTTISVTVLKEGDEGYRKYDKPVLETFTLNGYFVDKAYYFLSSDQRDIGLAGDERKFTSDSYEMKLFPSETVTLRYTLDAYFPKDTKVLFESSNENIVKVDENGKITAVAEGYASISVRVTMDGKNTYYSKSISIEVKDPYVTNGSILTSYFGNGGVVTIPESLSLTEIGQYAFSNYEYIEKAPHEITKEEPEATKIHYIGDNTIEEVIIPEGVKTIRSFAFANLTALKKIVLPSTIERIDQGAFYGCTSLVAVEGLEKVKFINQHAFYGCALNGKITIGSVAIADYAFAANEALEEVTLSASTQSVGAYAFAGCTKLKTVKVDADFVKTGQYIFSGCEALTELSINTAVVARGAFEGCTALEKVTLGKDVAVISEFAFSGTKVKELIIDPANTTFSVNSAGGYVTNKEGTELLLVLPSVTGSFTLTDEKIKTVASGAFAGCADLEAVELPHVTKVGSYAFARCKKLTSASFGALTSIGEYAFANTALKAHPALSAVKEIGDHAFAESALESVTVADGTVIGEYAFSECKKLASVTIGDNVTIGDHAFFLETDFSWEYEYYVVGTTRYYNYVFVSPIHVLTIGDNAKIGDYAFHGAAELQSVTLGGGATIGDYAFYNASSLKSIDLSKVLSIGEAAFAGDQLYVGLNSSFSVLATDEDGFYMYSYHAPVLREIDLSSATELGKFAFAYCKSIETVRLGADLTKIPEAAFMSCEALKEIDLSLVESVGDSAFYETALTKAELPKAGEIGKYAFSYAEELTDVTLSADGVKIGEGAFSYCAALEAPVNANKITSVGDYAFAYSAIEAIDLSSAEYVGTHAFLAEEATPLTVVLGSGLKDLGDNPFAMRTLPAFTAYETVVFNETEYEIPTTTYNVSETVRVVNGLLYRVVPNGLELIAYAGDDTAVTVADETVRVSAMAFAGTGVERVVLPYTVKSIGHKALYDCRRLALVSFSSYDAPILEEEYDYLYFVSGEHIPATGVYTFSSSDGLSTIEKNGIGLLPYFMWNAAETPATTYYGATFVDYIGYVDAPVAMIRPANGKNYDSFIFSLYFDTVIDGTPAADDNTLAAIAAIDRLPDPVTLTDKELVAVARAAYDRISNLEQRALVTAYAKLTQAEKRISDLEFLASGGGSETTPEDETTGEEPTEPIDPDLIAIILLSTVSALFLVTAVVFATLLLKQKKAERAASAPATEQETAPPEDPETSKENPGEVTEDSEAPAEHSEASAEETDTVSEPKAEDAADAPSEATAESPDHENTNGETEPKSEASDEE